MAENLIALFKEELAKGKLLGSKCKNCGAAFIPPRKFCPHCGGEAEAFTFKGEGTIESFTVIHVAPKQFAGSAPYILALVRLDGGAMLMGRLQGFDPSKPEEIPLGGKVKFEPLKEKRGEAEEVIPSFKPV
ncbi:transcriptional regulator [Candidatus Bathyarchaeota archaeon]|nr:MAG: transcriptional regulator [Candidatus Bathyarchaeota archaeon]